MTSYIMTFCGAYSNAWNIPPLVCVRVCVGLCAEFESTFHFTHMEDDLKQA